MWPSQEGLGPGFNRGRESSHEYSPPAPPLPLQNSSFSRRDFKGFF